jgi:hypothetical protein
MLPNRTYFFNVKENRMGDLYLNIVESKDKEGSGFERQSVIIFADDLPAFLGDFDKALKVLEKTVREQKRAPKRGDDARERGDRGKRDDRGGSDRGDKKSYRPKGKTTNNENSRRVIVKKQD